MRLAANSSVPVKAANSSDGPATTKIESPVPTRAEVSDVATAIYEGADAIMLSAESAAGKFPIEAVTTMDNVARAVEKDPTYRQVIEASRAIRRETVADGIVSGESVVCPLHAWRINLGDGKVDRPGDVTACVQTYPTFVDNGIIVVGLPAADQPSTEAGEAA